MAIFSLLTLRVGAFYGPIWLLLQEFTYFNNKGTGPGYQRIAGLAMFEVPGGPSQLSSVRLEALLYFAFYLHQADPFAVGLSAFKRL